MIILQDVAVRLSIKDESGKELFNFDADLRDKDVGGASEEAYTRKVQEVVEFLLFMMNDFSDAPQPLLPDFDVDCRLVS